MVSVRNVLFKDTHDLALRIRVISLDLPSNTAIKVMNSLNGFIDSDNGGIASREMLTKEKGFVWM